MRLIIGVPDAEVRERPSLLLLMLAACAEMQAKGIAGETVATLDDFPAQLDLALDLVEAVNQLRQAQVTMNGRAVADLNKLWSTLSCYRESLGEADPQAYCRRQAAPAGEAGRCPEQACVAHCPFLCAGCVEIVGEQAGLSFGDRLCMAAARPEVEWCPNLSVLSLSYPNEREGHQRG
jgi:hypothetical protein